MKAAEWFAKASAEGAFCGERRPKTPLMEESNLFVDRLFAPQVVDIWNAATRRFGQIWSDTGLPYNPKVHGGR